MMRFKLASIYTNPFIRLFEYTIGVLLATIDFDELKSAGTRKYTIMFFALWIVSSVLLVYYISKYGVIDNYMIYSIFFLPIWLILIFAFSRVKMNNQLLQKTVYFFSGISYDMFLVQFFIWPIIKAIDGAAPLINIIKIILVFGLCIILSIVLHYVFEVPVRKILKKRLIQQ